MTAWKLFWLFCLCSEALPGDVLPSGAVIRLGTARLRHPGPVESISFSPDSRLVATTSATTASAIFVWNTETGACVAAFQGSSGPSPLVAFAPREKVLIGFLNGEILAWDWPHFRRRWAVPVGDKSDPVSGLCVSADGANVFAVHRNGTFRQLDVHSGKIISEVPRTGVGPLHLGVLARWDIRNAEQLKSLTEEIWSPKPCSLRVGRSGLWCGVGFHAGTVLSGKRGERPEDASEIKISDQAITAVAVSEDGRALAAGNATGDLLFVDVRTKKAHSLCRSPSNVSSLAFSGDERLLAVGREDGTVTLWDASTGKQRLPVCKDARLSLTDLRYMERGTLLVASNVDHSIRCWDVAAQRIRWQKAAPAETAYECAKQLFILSDHRSLLSLSALGRVHVWDGVSGKLIRRLNVPATELRTAACSPTAPVLAVAYEKQICLWDTVRDAELRTLDVESSAWAMAFSPDGTTLAAGGLDAFRRIRVWDVRSGRELGSLTGHIEAVRLFSFSPERDFLASAGDADGTVLVWKVNEGRLIHRLPFAGRGVSAIAFSKDGRLLAVCGSESTVASDDNINVFELDSGTELCRFRAGKWGISAARFSPIGNTIATAGGDSTMLIWDVERACREPLANTSPPSREDLDRLWGELASRDGRRAYRALYRLAASPDRSVAFLEARLRSLALAEQYIDDCLLKLDSASFQERRKAMKEMENTGDLAENALRVRLSGKHSLEFRQRAEQLLDTVQQGPSTRLQSLRSLQVLERISRPDAVQAVKELSLGPSNSFVAKEAREVLQRVGGARGAQ
jgi:WD40 repeat protein